MIYKKTKFASYVQAYVEQKYCNANILLMSISDNIFYCSLIFAFTNCWHATNALPSLEI